MRFVQADAEALEAAVHEAAAVLRAGGLVAFPTETVYGLGAHALDPAAVERIYRAKGRPAYNPLIVHVATVDAARALSSAWPAAADRLAERFWPGPLTLVVPKSSAIPDAVSAGLATVGIRIPAHPVPMAMLEQLDEPLLSTTLILPAHGLPLNDAEEIRRHLEHFVELVIDSGSCDGQPTTVIDLSTDAPRLVREGAGDIRPFGFVKESLH